MSRPDPAFWAGKRVLLTGHTGFKGGWAAIWLAALGARVTGLALAPDQTPALYDLAGIEGLVRSRIVDLRAADAVEEALSGETFDLVLHMAAQPIVRAAIEDPVGTFASNIMGTAHLLQALRAQPALQACLVVTSDKVYANAETGHAFAEDDPLGGKDPYSASKAAAEIVVQSFARSFYDRPGFPWPPPGAGTSSAAGTSPAIAWWPTSCAPARPRARPCCAIRRRPAPGSTCSTAWRAISSIWSIWRSIRRRRGRSISGPGPAGRR
ncbi:NAD-dependent epimerase/dehydratase family protein [Phenylobacterium aquaticum]|uniref:NAD-dependent epimerase/dehydratase family protein n=1 Tax=Phenylobacterium aquaticum TaxID=1763816 RepID=UPI001F5C57CF|nr:NAD-dependent epimerase/dehydratase family protein [Phenylobacterium aquaticum]MCI3134247.1 GDP-mannose 4,6-dehydratase [Phenylobacterium aquaticum]